MSPRAVAARILRVVLAVLFAGSLPASATTIPADLEAHAAELRRLASPQLLAWVHEQGVALAKAQGPVNVRALGEAVRTQLARKPAPASRSGVSGPVTSSWTVLGSLADADIEAICFLVLMEASKSAQEDLKAIMARVKSINNAKAQQRSAMQPTERLAPTPTSAPDRVAQLVAAARSVQGKIRGADLSTIVRR